MALLILKWFTSKEVHYLTVHYRVVLPCYVVLNEVFNCTYIYQNQLIVTLVINQLNGDFSQQM